MIDGKKVRFYIWVTSDCNLACPYCIQAYPMVKHAGYQMSMKEVNIIVDSCKRRGLHFDQIEVTGGEASMWNNLEEGYIKFLEIADEITLATNGNNPQRIINLGMRTWIVSSSQATKAQVAQYKKIDRGQITWNSHQHKQMPTEPIAGVLPAKCCTAVNPQLEPQIAIEYVLGRVWYCPDACAHSELTGEYDEIVCDFEDDFIAKYKDKKFDQKTCQICLGNQKIWKML